MKEEQILELLGLEEFSDFELLGAKWFENLICEKLSKFGRVERQVKVANRGDGRSGFIDLVFYYQGRAIPIELDRKLPRQKSIFKVRSYNPQDAFVITRDPLRVIKV